MSEYRLSKDGVIRLVDGAFIPYSPTNSDYQAYLVWLTRGGIPEQITEEQRQEPDLMQEKLDAIINLLTKILEVNKNFGA